MKRIKPVLDVSINMFECRHINQYCIYKNKTQVNTVIAKYKCLESEVVDYINNFVNQQQDMITQFDINHIYIKYNSFDVTSRMLSSAHTLIISAYVDKEYVSYFTLIE